MSDNSERLLIQVKVQTRSSRTGVERLGPLEFRVRVSAAPVKGEANRQVMKLLAGYFDIPPGAVSIIKGLTSSRKTVAVLRPGS